MNGYRLEQLQNDYHLVLRGQTKIAIVFPADSSGRLALYPHPDTFPGINFDGLPEPLQPGWMKFGSIADIEAFLGIEPAREAA